MSDGNKLDWHGDEAIAYVRAKAAAGLQQAAYVLRNRAAELLSLPGTASAKGGRGSGKRKGARIAGAVRSKPGEPPRKQTGRLWQSVTLEVEDMAARVGTNVPYGKYLELGTKRGIAPRPWLRRALYEVQAKITELMSGSNP